MKKINDLDQIKHQISDEDYQAAQLKIDDLLQSVELLNRSMLSLFRKAMTPVKQEESHEPVS